MLLDLRENSKIATAATFIITEAIIDILKLHLNFFVKKWKNHLRKYGKWKYRFCNWHQFKFRDPFVLACKKKKKKCREKAFSSYFKTRGCHIEPVEKTVGCNYKTSKLDQLKPSFVAVWECGYLLGTTYVQQHSRDLNVFDNFNKGKIFRNDKLLSNILHEIQIVFYHYDFGVSNPQGNKTKKHKISAFYFVLWGIFLQNIGQD